MTEITWDEEALCELRCSTLSLGKRGGADLARRFNSKVEAAIVSARAIPLLHRKHHHGARRVLVERFPYYVVYWHDEERDGIHIVAIAHTSRDPDYWRDRMP